MRVLVLGGTKFIGPHVVEQLRDAGHEVTLFCRGETRPELFPDLPRVRGDRRKLAEHAADLRAVRPDVVVDMIAMTEADARCAVEVFDGHAGRYVLISSGDVYRAFGVIHRTEEGPPQAVPLRETDALRTNLFPFESAPDYDKIPVERVAADLGATILRLPMVHGPHDPLRRCFDYVKRMDDRRPAILIDERTARWRFPRGYVTDVARAIVLAATRPEAAGRTYNVAEHDALTRTEWIERIAAVVGWEGRIVALPPEGLPEHLREKGNPEQDFAYDTTRIRDELGFAESFELDDWLRQTIEWERGNPPDPVDPARFDYAAEDAALAT